MRGFSFNWRRILKWMLVLALCAFFTPIAVVLLYMAASAIDRSVVAKDKTICDQYFAAAKAEGLLRPDEMIEMRPCVIDDLGFFATCYVRCSAVSNFVLGKDAKSARVGGWAICGLEILDDEYVPNPPPGPCTTSTGSAAAFEDLRPPERRLPSATLR